MTNSAAQGARAKPAPRYSESVHLLMDEPTRAAVVGLAVIAARDIGPDVRPREGETLRGLVEASLERIQREAPTLYADALDKGRAELSARAASNRRRAK
jgi:hypothetical protein